MSYSHKEHKNLVRLSTVSKGKANEMKVRRSRLQTMGKMHLKAKHASPEVAMRQIMLFEKQRDFLMQQQETFERKSKELKECITKLEEKIKTQRKEVQKMVGEIGKGIKDGKSMEDASGRKKQKTEKRKNRSKPGLFTLGY